MLVSLCCFLMAHICCCCLQQAQQRWQCMFHFCCFLMSHVTVSNNACFTLLLFDVSCFFVYSKPNKGVFVAFNKVVMAWAPNWHLFAQVDCSAGWKEKAQVYLTITLWVGDRCWWQTSLWLLFVWDENPTENKSVFDTKMNACVLCLNSVKMNAFLGMFGKGWYFLIMKKSILCLCAFCLCQI